MTEQQKQYSQVILQGAVAEADDQIGVSAVAYEIIGLLMQVGNDEEVPEAERISLEGCIMALILAMQTLCRVYQVGPADMPTPHTLADLSRQAVKLGPNIDIRRVYPQ